MIHLLGLGYNGRLGNQLFLYAAGKALSLKNNTELGLLDFSSHVCHGQPCLLDEFNLSYVKVSSYERTKFLLTDPPANFEYLADYDKLPDWSALNGHFVHYNYFSKYKDIIINEFKIKNTSITKDVTNKLAKYKYPVAVHFRLGDMPEEVKTQVYEYTFQALKEYPKDTDFIIVGGGNRDKNNILDDTEVSNIKKIMSGKKYTFLHSENTILDLEIMSNCKGNIVSLHSTYSWWAAYRNTQSEKVVYPKANHVKPLPTWTLV